jgi:hypothetical protein
MYLISQSKFRIIISLKKTQALTLTTFLINNKVYIPKIKIYIYYCLRKLYIFL